MFSILKCIFTQKKKMSIKIMKDFVEGRICAEDFWNILKEDEVMKKILRRNKHLYACKVYFEEINLEKTDVSKLSERIAIFRLIKYFLEKNNYKITPYNIEEKKYMFLSDIQPKWIDITDDELLINIVNSAPLGLSKEKNKQWCKSKIKELFKYDKKPPEWVQEPEWPIVNGEPLIFKHKTEDGSKISYYFYNFKTQEEVEIIQYE